MRDTNAPKYVLLSFGLYSLSEVVFVWRMSFPIKGEFFKLLYKFGGFSLYFAVAFVLLHSVVTLGKRKTAIFFSLAVLIGFLSELFGTLYGWIFGQYYYSESMRSLLGLMSFATPFSWGAIIYICYSLTNLFLSGLGGEKPRQTDRFWRYIGAIVLLSSIDGLAAMNLDMILELVSVSIGAWTWSNGGPYFGIPISNFIGWFLVTFVSTFFFRNYESYTKQEMNRINGKIDCTIVGVYSIYLSRNAALALVIGHQEYALIGVATMLPFVLIALLMFLVKRSRARIGTSCSQEKL